MRARRHERLLPAFPPATDPVRPRVKQSFEVRHSHALWLGSARSATLAGLTGLCLLAWPGSLSAELSFSEQQELLERVRSAPLPSGRDAFNCPILTGASSIAAPKLFKPPYLGSVVDPVFGHPIVRITGDPGQSIPNAGTAKWGTRERHHYSLHQPWNANATLLVLETSNVSHHDLYLDGQTYEVLFARKLSGGGERRWHPTKPELRIYMRNNEIGYWNPITNRLDVLTKVSGYSAFKFGPSKGGPSHDGRRIVVQARNPQKQCVAFAYDLEDRRKYPDIPLSECSGWVTMSASGNYILFHYGKDQNRIYDLEGRDIGPLWSGYGEPSHADLGLTPAGEDVAVGINKNPQSKHVRKMIMRSLSDGGVVPLTSKPRFTHTSTKNYWRPGWAYGSGFGDIAAMKLDGSGRIERYGNARAMQNGYYSEPHGVPSPDGARILFASNWGEMNGPIGAYVLEICGD